MRLLTREIRVRDLDAPVRLHATGDWHVGEMGCSEGRLRRALEAVRDDEGAIAILMGDLGGFLAPDDRRWEPAAVADGLTIADLEDWGHMLVERCCRIAAPLRGRVVASLAGNHELTYARRHHVDIPSQLAGGLGCPPLGYAALITLRFIGPGGHSRDLRIMATHGAGAAATPGGKLNRLIRTMSIAAADLVLMGHVHACMSTTSMVLEQRGDRIGERLTLGVITGTYLRTYSEGHSGYGERAGYQPTTLGHPVISVTPADLSMSVRWV